MDELDQLYYRNLIRGTKLKISKRELDKKELASLRNYTSSKMQIIKAFYIFILT